MEASSFKQRFMPHWRHLFWTAWRLTGNTQDAEDLVQEAFLKLWTKRENLGDINNDEAYLTTFLTNMFRDQHRRKHLDMADSPPETLAITDGNNLMTQLEARDESEQVNLLIKQLPKQQQRILMMHAVDNLSASEIENETGLSAVNIRSLLSRARKNIKQKFYKT
ncbi:MAG: RNA polymerase sigma factor [Prevotella sp.]|nr:RNA polymerase sigma factor [Prevotella sp.]